MRSAWIAAATALLAAACDGDGDSSPTYGTCDRSAMPAVAQCIEMRAPPGNIAAQREECAELGGAWHDRPCPSSNAIGCCRYTVADGDWQMRECFYPNPDRDFDPEYACTAWIEDFTGTPGIWTPAP
jgi:hypothetical protein